eukprot:766255-Hanusia_phi.AAC.1
MANFYLVRHPDPLLSLYPHLPFSPPSSPPSSSPPSLPLPHLPLPLPLLSPLPLLTSHALPAIVSSLDQNEPSSPFNMARGRWPRGSSAQ